MAKSRIRIAYKAGDAEKAIKAIKEPIASAASDAMAEAASIARAEGRANIRAAGFSQKWANALRTEVFPRPPRVSMGAAAIVFHKIGYSEIFETGGTIAGKPLLWLALRSTPKKVGGRRMTPAQYVRQVGPLFSIERAGKPPLLAGKIAVNRRGQVNKSKVTLSALRRAGQQGAASRLVPLFIGIDRVTLRDRFSIAEITESAANRLAELYAKHLNPG